MVRYSSINGRKIRIGVIGCGRISKKHFDAIEQFRNDLELVAVCDVNSRICAEYSKIYSVPAYKNISELLKKEADIYIGLTLVYRMI